MSLLEQQPNDILVHPLDETQLTVPETLDIDAVGYNDDGRIVPKFVPKAGTTTNGELVDPQIPKKFATIRTSIAHAGDLEQTYKLTDVDTDSVNTFTRAVEFYGSKVAEEMHMPEAELDVVVEEVRAISRSANSLGRLVRPGLTAARNDDSMIALVEQQELADAKGLMGMPATESTSESNLKFIAVSLDHMRRTKNVDPIEKKAANLALEELVVDPEKAVVVVEALHPEKVRRLKLASLAGNWAVKRTAKRAVSIPKLAV